MSRQRSASTTRQLFSQCALIEIIHLHDCLRGALYEIQNDVETLVRAASCIHEDGILLTNPAQGRITSSRSASASDEKDSNTKRTNANATSLNLSSSANSNERTLLLSSSSFTSSTSVSATSRSPAAISKNSTSASASSSPSQTTTTLTPNTNFKPTQEENARTSASAPLADNNNSKIDIVKNGAFEIQLASNLSGKIASRFHLIWSVFQAHSGAEDEFIWPALKMKLARNHQNAKRQEEEEKRKMKLKKEKLVGENSQTNHAQQQPQQQYLSPDLCTTTATSSSTTSIQQAQSSPNNSATTTSSSSKNSTSSKCGCESILEQEEYEEDHAEEEKMFKQINSTLRRLKGSFRYYEVSVSKAEQQEQQIQALYIIKQAILHLQKQTTHLTQHLETHLQKEEKQCLPMVQKHLTTDEISSLVGNIMGKRSAEVMTKILNLALCSLPADEREDMVAHMKKAMVGTFFERWLTMGGWVSSLADEQKRGYGMTSPLLNPSDGGGGGERLTTTTKRQLSLNSSGVDGPPKKKMARNDKGNSRLRRPSKWYRRDEDENITLAWCSSSKTSSECEDDIPLFTQTELIPTYHFSDSQGGPVFGCDHYARACKLRHPATGELFTCRLCCEVAREKNRYDNDTLPVLDRNAVTEVLCMRCGALQPAGSKCVNPDCSGNGKPYARYSCNICNLHDDAPDNPIYHCPYCNVCRKGKGLGIDFHHCMRCNACVAISAYSEHVCIPQRLQGDCPICRETLFESTEPLRGLECGHVLHLSCFNKYASRSQSGKITCPLCKASFDR